MRTIIFFLAIIAIAYAQIGDYSHFVGGQTNRAGWHPANQFVAWDNANNKYIDIPQANFGGGSVKQVAAVGSGIMAVGTFNSVNGQAAYGIAFYNGTQWCSLPHLSLYRYSNPLPSAAGLASQFPIQSSAAPGTAMGIYVRDNQVYIFGGRSGGSPRFNAIGNILNANNVGFSGLCRLNIAQGGSNFTLDTSFNSFRSQGTGAPYLDPGFAADSAPNVPDSGNIKFRVGGTQASPFIVVGVLDNGAASSVPQVWNPSWGGWITNLAAGQGVFNVSGITGLVTGFTRTNPPTSGGVTDFDVDVTSNPPVVILVGTYNQQVQNAPYYLAATISLGGISSVTPSLTFSPSITFPANFPQNGFQEGIALVVANPNAANDYWIAARFNESIASTAINRIYRDVRFNRIFRVTGSGFNALGERFSDLPNQLLVSNNIIFAFFGANVNYNLINPNENYSQIRFTRKFSPAICWNGNDWQDAFGGFVNTVSPWYSVAFRSAPDTFYIYGASTTGVYDLFTNGLVAFNNNANQKRWVRASTQRLALRPSGALAPANGGNNFNPFTTNDGLINTVHFLQSQPSGVTDAVVVAGSFDWYGTLFLGSVAYVRTDSISADGRSTGTATWEQLGGGLWNSEINGAFTLDLNSPLLSAGEVLDIEEANGKLYAGGVFSKNLNGLCVNNIGAVNYKDGGSLWYGLGSGCNAVVCDLLADGSKVYAGGQFTNCGGVPGTRGVAYWDEGENPPRWKAMGTGFPTASINAIEKFRGNIYVGGSGLSGSPASIRFNSGRNGLYRWNGDKWSPVYARCQEFCGQSEFEAPIQSASNFDPTFRALTNVRSLRTYAGTLYVQGNIGGSDFLFGYDGTRWSQFGSATGAATCKKQGCIATNATGNAIVGVNFNENSGSFNPNIQAWDKGKTNWVDTATGVDSAIFVASASVFPISIIFAVVLAIFVFIF